MAEVDNGFLSAIRETVTIIRPMPSVVPRGQNSPRVQQAVRTVRVYPEHLETIDEASKLVKMSRSAFMIWCAYYVALDIIRQHNEYRKKQRK